MFYPFGEDTHKKIEGELIEDHRSLFRKYFESDEKLDEFINKNLDVSKGNIQRRSINNIQKLVALADELIIVKPGKCDLAIFFLLSCIESLYTLNNYKMQKQEMIIDFFENYITDDECNFLIKSIMVSSRTLPYDYEITIERFSLLLVAIRNHVTHEGIYWNSHFIAEEANERTPIMNSFLAKPDKNSKAQKVVFTNTMKFSELRDIFIKGFICFVIKHESNNSVE